MTSLIILILLFGMFYVVDHRHRKLSLLSPTMCLGVPLLFVIIISFFIGPQLGFIQINIDALNIWLLGLFSFWLGGFIMTSIMPKSLRVKVGHFDLTKNQSKYNWVHFSCLVIVLIAFAGLRTTLAEVGDIDSLEKGQFAAHGIVGHINGFIVGYCIFYILSLKTKLGISKKYALIFILSIIFLKMATRIRGDAVLIFLGGFIALGLTKRISLSYKTIIISSIGILLFFSLMTVLRFDEMELTYLLIYIFFYINAGVLGLSGVLEGHLIVIGKRPDFVLNFFMNAWRSLFGSQKDYTNVTLEVFAPVTEFGAKLPLESNVYTLIGDVYINCGYIIGCVYFFTLGAYAYFLFLISSKSVFLCIAYSFVAACLFLGFFGEYVLNVYFYTIQIMLFVMHFFYRLTVSKTRI